MDAFLPIHAFLADGKGIFDSPLVFYVGVIFIVMFVVVLPGRKDQKKRASMQESLKRGDRVLTQSGIIGRIAQNKGEEVTLEIDGAKLVMLRSMIVKVIDETKAAEVEKK